MPHLRPTDDVVLTAASPTTLLDTDKIREQLRVDASMLSNDAVDDLNERVTQLLASYLQRPLLEQTWRFHFARLPRDGECIQLSTSPVRSIDKIATYERDETEHALTTDDWKVFGVGDSPQPREVKIWSTADRWNFEVDNLQPYPYPLRVEASVGWERANVPGPIIQCGLMICADWYSQRRSGVSVNLYQVPHGTRHLIDEYRRQPRLTS